LVGYQREDEDRRGDAEGQPDDVDAGVGLLADKGAPGYFEIVFYHGFSFIIGVMFYRET